MKRGILATVGFILAATSLPVKRLAADELTADSLRVVALQKSQLLILQNQVNELKNTTQAQQNLINALTQRLDTLYGQALSKADAAQVYQVRSEAENTYQTKAEAANVYLTKNGAASQYLALSTADSNYLKKMDASFTYLPRSDADANFIKRNAYYKLTTAFKEPANLCLEGSDGTAKNPARLDPCGNFSGQMWKLK